MIRTSLPGFSHKFPCIRRIAEVLIRQGACRLVRVGTSYDNDIASIMKKRHDIETNILVRVWNDPHDQRKSKASSARESNPSISVGRRLYIE